MHRKQIVHHFVTISSFLPQFTLVLHTASTFIRTQNEKFPSGKISSLILYIIIQLYSHLLRPI